MILDSTLCLCNRHDSGDTKTGTMGKSITGLSRQKAHILLCLMWMYVLYTSNPNPLEGTVRITVVDGNKNHKKSQTSRFYSLRKLLCLNKLTQTEVGGKVVLYQKISICNKSS